MSSIDRFDLPPAKGGAVQWADIHYRPTHGQTTAIEKATWKARNHDAPGMTTEDGVVSVLVTDWSVFDDEGEPIPFKLAEYQRVPAATWVVLTDECDAILGAIRPAQALTYATRALAGLRDVVGQDKRERVGEIIEELAELAGATGPNGKTQAG